jgi:hypothetical protein
MLIYVSLQNVLATKLDVDGGSSSFAFMQYIPVFIEKTGDGPVISEIK